MNQSGPLLTSSDTIVWLKVLVSAALLVLLTIRHARRNTVGSAPRSYALGVKLAVGFAVLLSFAAFHSFGSPRSSSFVHYGEMFHYYLGPKYFRELGHYDLYNAVIAADAEQDRSLAKIPFYTDLTTYQNASRDAALQQIPRVKARFAKGRWRAFKRDVAYFKAETSKPGRPPLYLFLMDHGYNASPVATLVLGLITNVVPVTQLALLASLDLLLVATMIGLVFRTFGLLTGGLFSVYFFVNILNDHGYISGGLLRYDWLVCVVAGVCLLEKRRHAASAFFLALAAMLKVFPAVLFYGIGVTMFQRWKTSRVVEPRDKRFVLSAVATVVVLFVLPAAYLGSVLQPWQEFSEKTALHDRGVYVNHLGLRGVLLFEPSHLSLDAFVDAFREGASDDIVRNWQDAKEQEFAEKKPLILVSALLVLACITVILWKRRPPDTESVLWPLLLIYVASYPSHYYYAFLCLFILLFFRRPNSLGALVPICLLLVFNIAALLTDAAAPSPIAFYTLINGYLFVCLSAMLGFELFDVFRQTPEPALAAEPVVVAEEKKASAKQGRGRGKPRALRRAFPI